MGARSKSYRRAIAWIADNDEPCEDDASVVSEQLTVLVTADSHGVAPLTVARAVLRHRKENP